MADRDNNPALELTSHEVAAANQLTTRWIREFAQDGAPAPEALSGAGVWPLLVALASGAEGDTRSQLCQAAGVEAANARAIVKAFAEALGHSPAVRLALGLWESEHITLDPEWTDGLPGDWIGSLSGDPATDKLALDAWAAERTDGLIDEMSVDLTQPVDLVLATALALRTTWVEPFQDTDWYFRSGPWAELGGCQALTRHSVDLDALRVVGREVTVLRVQGVDDVDVLLALGETDADPDKVLATAIEAAGSPGLGTPGSALAVGAVAPGVTVGQVEVPFPDPEPLLGVTTVRFDVAAEHDLMDSPELFGIEAASSSQTADFPAVAAEPIWIDQAKQSCVATFSATGFEAAAVTAFGMTAGAALLPDTPHLRKEVQVDFMRPFGYVAVHRPTGLALMAGWVHQPSLSEDPEPQSVG